MKIDKNTDFTPSSLVKYLNERYGRKQGKNSRKKGKPFNKQDVQQYSMRGSLPARYGGHKIRVIREMGIVILRIPTLREDGRD